MLDALEEAERAGLVIAQQVKRETRYAFAHELVRQTLVGTLTVPRRLRRHLRTAEAIEKVYAGKLELHASELAYHFFQSGSAQHEAKTTRYLLLTGQQALEAGAFDEALAHVEKAFSIIETADARRRADLLWVKGSALRGLGRWRDATAAYLEAFDPYEVLGAQAELLQLTCMLAGMLYYVSDHSQMVAIVERALRATDDTPSADRARLLAFGGNALALCGNYPDGMAMIGRALAMAAAIGDQETRAEALGHRASILHHFGRIADATPNATEAYAALARSGKRWGALTAGARLQQCYRWNGHQRGVISMCEDLRREAAEVGHLGAKLGVATGILEVQWMQAPNVDQLLAAATTITREFAELGTWGQAASLYTAFAHFDRDDADPSAALEGAAERFGFESYRDAFWAYYFYASAHTHPERALAILDANATALPTLGRPAFLGAWSALRWVLVGLIRLGVRTRAAGLYPHFLELERMGFVGGFGGLTETAAGIAAAAGERWDDAEEHFERALRAANEMPHVPEQADIRYWHAWMLLARRAAGDVERSRAMLEEAIPMFDRAGRKRRKRESEELLRASHLAPRAHEEKAKVPYA